MTPARMRSSSPSATTSAQPSPSSSTCSRPAPAASPFRPRCPGGRRRGAVSWSSGMARGPTTPRTQSWTRWARSRSSGPRATWQRSCPARRGATRPSRTSSARPSTGPCRRPTRRRRHWACRSGWSGASASCSRRVGSTRTTPCPSCASSSRRTSPSRRRLTAPTRPRWSPRTPMWSAAPPPATRSSGKRRSSGTVRRSTTF
mmetsp:Transcript_56999/g.176838  ORF Transcript_56999/g.176838 Transcript_56999/m.176838 type:complete len:202 (-) Transcript_56999:349-954(-)